jgi:hypothetical protein
MSFQAYLDTIEAKTGLTPRQLIDLAHDRGFGPGTKAGPILQWLSDDYGLGRGHGMALVHVITKGDQISPTHVGTGVRTAMTATGSGSTVGRRTRDADPLDTEVKALPDRVERSSMGG